MAGSLSRIEREQMLNCGICGSRLVDPRLLFCLHSFCKECLVIKQEQAADTDAIVCELCGYQTDLSSPSIDSLTSNIFLTNIAAVDQILNSNRKFHCSFCKEREQTVEASSLCLSCGDWLCLTCAERHCLTRITKNHKVVAIDDVRADPQYSSDLRKLYDTKCLDHPDERVIEVCCQCDTPVCFECTQTTHKQHESIPLDDAKEEVRENLASLLQMYEGVLECDNEAEEQIANRLKEVKSKEDNLLQLVHTTRDSLIEDINQQATAAESAISHPFEMVKMSLSQALKSVRARAETTQRSRLFCEKLHQEGLGREYVHFMELFKKVKTAGYRREKVENQSIPDLKLNISKFSMPKIFNVSQADLESVNDTVEEKVLLTHRLVGEEDILIPAPGNLKAIISQGNEEFKSRGIDVSEKDMEEKVLTENDLQEGAVGGFDYESCESDSDDTETSDICFPKDPVYIGDIQFSDDEKMITYSEDEQEKPCLSLPSSKRVKAEDEYHLPGCENEDIIKTLKVKEHAFIPLSIHSDQTSPVVNDICWLTEAEFAVGDKANQMIKVFNDKGKSIWFKNMHEGSVERLACIDGVIASDYPSGVHLETRNESFSKIYCSSRTLTTPYPIAKTHMKEVIIGNRDFPDLRCYSKKGNRIQRLSLGRKVNINYIAQSMTGDFFLTEKSSKSVMKFHKGQKLRVFFKGLPHWEPQGVAIDSGDNVYVCDNAGGNVVKLSPGGNVLGILEVHPSGPRGMSISRQNRLLVNDDQGNAWMIQL